MQATVEEQQVDPIILTADLYRVFLFNKGEILT